MKMRLRRGAILALFTAGGLWAIAGCGSSNSSGSNLTVQQQQQLQQIAGRSQYVGEAVCKGCHADKRENWSHTAHASALQALKNIKQDTNKNCIGCHTVGYGKEGGYTNETLTPHLANVQCEACHGPGAAHVANPGGAPVLNPVQVAALKTQAERDKAFMRLVPSSRCGGCHTDAHHPTYDEWLESKHSKSIEDVHNATCARCHTAEGFVNALDAPTQPEQAERVTATGEPASTSDECWTCHDPHKVNASAPRQLRQPVNTLCRNCHTFREEQGTNPSAELNTRAVHNPQAEVLNAAGGFSWDGDTWKALSLPAGHGLTHTEATGGECSRCHVWTVSVPNPTEELPNSTGHSFRPNLNACAQAGCHINLAPRQAEEVEFTGEAITEGASPAVIAFWQEHKNANQAKIDKLKAALAKVDVDKLTSAQFRGYLTAKWDYDLCRVDKSEGIHNEQYVNLVLDTGLAICAQLPQKPPKGS